MKEKYTLETKQVKTSLLEYTQELYPDIDLSEFTLVTCHHMLEIDYRVLESLCAKGLKPENIYVLGKPYSTSKDVLLKYKKLGAYVDDASLVIDPKKSFDDYFNDVIEKFVDMVSGKVDGNVIVWDDGGLLNTQLNNIDNLPFNIVSSVEQTSSGFNKMTGVKLNFPIVNMARSKAKLQFESPFIADKNMLRLREYLQQNNRNIKSALIIGGGSIGQEMKKELEAEFVKVSVYDVAKGVGDYEKDSDLNKILERFDVIIGATGEQSLGLEQVKYCKEDAILCSISSSDREFDGAGWRRVAHITNTEVHNDIYLGGRVLLNNGFPLNFDGAPSSVPLKYIQLTGALTLASVYTGVSLESNTENVWIDIPKWKQEIIVGEFKQYVDTSL